MSIELKAYNATDRAQLFWQPDQPIPDCRGYAIEKTDAQGNKSYTHGFATFDNEKLSADNSSPDNCLKAPIQENEWYVSGTGEATFRVIPIVGSDKDHLQLREDLACEPVKVNVTHQVSKDVEVYFNHGIVADQRVAQYLKDHPDEKLADVIGEPGNELRNELSGDLRPRMLEMLREAKEQGKKVKLMLYELNDPELIDAIKALGPNCEIILANGAFKNNKPGENDENAQVREDLKAAGVDVTDRIVKTGHFDHNKVMIVCDAEGNPETVLTGSTNWTKTGLCSQANNAIIIHNAETAKDYSEEFDRVKVAGNDYTSELLEGNSKAITTHTLPDGTKITALFAPTANAEDMEFVRNLINNAKGAHFLNFNPGVFQDDPNSDKATLVQTIIERLNPESEHYDPNFKVEGVLNQNIPGLSCPKDSTEALPAGQRLRDNPVTLVSGRDMTDAYHGIVLPAAINNDKDDFIREQLKVAGTHAMVHSKYIVLDMGDGNYVTITGSHNMGFKASSKNDDNMTVVEGNKDVAAAYMLNERLTHKRYEFNDRMNQAAHDPSIKVFSVPVDNDSWQTNIKNDVDHQYWMSGMDAKAYQGQTHDTSTVSHRYVDHTGDDQSQGETESDGPEQDKPSKGHRGHATAVATDDSQQEAPAEAEPATRSHHAKAAATEETTQEAPAEAPAEDAPAEEKPRSHHKKTDDTEQTTEEAPKPRSHHKKTTDDGEAEAQPAHRSHHVMPAEDTGESHSHSRGA